MFEVQSCRLPVTFMTYVVFHEFSDFRVQNSVKEAVQCTLCKFVMEQLDKMLEDNATQVCPLQRFLAFKELLTFIRQRYLTLIFLFSVIFNCLRLDIAIPLKNLLSCLFKYFLIRKKNFVFIPILIFY